MLTKQMEIDLAWDEHRAAIHNPFVYRRRWLEQRFTEQQGLCAYCACAMTLEAGYTTTATVDHVLARSQGGLDQIENIVAACSRCNNAKGSMLVEEFVLNYVSSLNQPCQE
jgi:5-methylcytosine-specific restriction endonuclease McrA